MQSHTCVYDWCCQAIDEAIATCCYYIQSGKKGPNLKSFVLSFKFFMILRLLQQENTLRILMFSHFHVFIKTCFSGAKRKRQRHVCVRSNKNYYEAMRNHLQLEQVVLQEKGQSHVYARVFTPFILRTEYTPHSYHVFFLLEIFLENLCSLEL